jgi:DHA1 family tetracycline resistance protein-like MFS transporter
MDERGRRRALSTVALTLFLDLAGFGIILPILPYYAESFDASETAVALLSTAFSAAQFVMAPVLGRLSDRHGRRPVMLLSIFGSIAAGLVLGFAHALWVVFAARVVAGCCKANVSTAHAYVADLIPPKERAKYMGMMGAAMGMGFVFGPAIGGLLTFDDMPALPFFVSAALSAVNLAMAAIWLPETHFPDRNRIARSDATKERLSIGRRLRDTAGRIQGTPMAWLVVIAFCFFVAFAGMESTLALFSGRMFGWGGRETGMFMTFIGVNMVFFQGFVVGRAVAKLGETTTLAIGLGMVAFGLATIGGIDHIVRVVGFEPNAADGGASLASLTCYALGGIAVSGGNGMTSATISALVSRVSTPENQGMNMGVKESASALARVSGPAVAGPLFQHIEPGAPLMLGGLIALINVKLALMLGKRMQQREG